jgi:mono/diheme cytochrome c family protein
MRRQVVCSRALLSVCAAALLSVSVIARQGDAEAAKIKNPVASTPESVAAGKKVYDLNCAGCHGVEGKGGIVLSVIEDQGGNQPPALNAGKWTHGSSDGEIFTVIKKGIGPAFFMQPWDGRISDTDIWNVINYIRSIQKVKAQ